MMRLAQENRASGSNRTLALAFRHPDSNFDPDFFIARLHITSQASLNYYGDVAVATSVLATDASPLRSGSRGIGERRFN